MADDPRFPKVTRAGGRTAFGNPQTIPGAPHRAPSMVTLSKNSPLLASLNSGGPQNAPTNSGAPGDGNAPPFRDPHHYASIIEANVPVGIVSAEFLTQPVNKRNFLMFRNNSATANIYIGFSKDATTASMLRITPNTMVLFDVVVPQDDLYAIADAAGGSLSYGYSTIL